MPFTVNTNVASLLDQSFLNGTQAAQNRAVNRLSSGLRIINSGDDAAGLSIANGLRSDEAVLTQGVRNANDGLSALQVADGGLNNISQLLDRARTLATQSASGTFTGDRSVLNSEFSSVLTEIDRQSQAIGLNTGGTFATSLSVFIGGGTTSNGIAATANGSVSFDLSKSTVDSASLGLKDVQAIGVSGTDIGAGAASTSLAALLANATNTGSTAVPGLTSFTIKGPGFDGNGVKISVNTAGLAATPDLVAAVNAAIASAGNGGTQAATAFRNAGIVAGLNIDANGKQQLTFKSSTAAFQVGAGDRLSNALLGNFAQNAISTGTDTAAYADTSGANNRLTFAIDGAAAFDVNLATNAKGTSKGQIVDDLNANATFSAVATASLSGNQVVITSKNTGSRSSVAVTSSAGTLSTTLGFSGTATAAAGSTGATLDVQTQGPREVAAAANVIATDTGATITPVTGTSDTLILTVGSSGAQTLTLNGETAESKAQLAADINAKIAANGNFTAANNALVSASVVNNQIVLTAGLPGQSITIGAGTANGIIGLTNGTVSSTNTVATADTIKLRFQGSGLTSPVDITLATTTPGTTTTAQVLTDLQNKVAGSTALSQAGITLTTASQGDQLVFTSSKGEQFQVVASGDSRNILGLGSFLAGASGAVDYTSISAANAYSQTTPSGTASFEVSLNGLKSSSNTFSADLTAGDATSGTSTTAVTFAAGVVDLSGGGNGNLVLKVDGGAAQTAALGTSATTTIASILTAINGLSGVTATLSGSNLVITSSSKGANSSVEIATGTAANVVSKLGVTVGTVSRGQNASETNVLQQLNSSIATNATLSAAGLKAVDDPNNAGHILIQSTNDTYFRLNAVGGATAGFGTLGASFTGNTQYAAPAASPDFDAQGADASATLAYTDTLFGSDKQTVTVGATDATGAKHSLGVTLQNNNVARNQSIDQALSTINTALQQSNDTTLNQVVAVKEDVAGVQSIRFLSILKGFDVSVGTDANGTGITPPATNPTVSTTVGIGATADISNVTSATAAVTALATSVSLLGKAQGVIGRSQNQLNFAITLAQSQLTNKAAAESRIRDADLAAESANLTKSNILLQAGVAALAQANSAPQQVLALLRF